MQVPFPHRYVVTSLVRPDPDVTLESPGLPALGTRLPTEFGGPGDRWSPETLLTAAIADCYAMTFRGLAARSHLAWSSLNLEVTGILDRPDGVTRFTEIHILADLALPDCRTEPLARRILQKANETCLITRSMTATTHLVAGVECATDDVYARVAS
jgi:organic hydroperoxide reductase OsmC/OhrA